MWTNPTSWNGQTIQVIDLAHDLVCGLCVKDGVSALHFGQRMLTPSTHRNSRGGILYAHSGH
jgi:hypothetical protein